MKSKVVLTGFRAIKFHDKPGRANIVRPHCFNAFAPGFVASQKFAAA